MLELIKIYFKAIFNAPENIKKAIEMNRKKEEETIKK